MYVDLCVVTIDQISSSVRPSSYIISIYFIILIVTDLMTCHVINMCRCVELSNIAILAFA